MDKEQYVHIRSSDPMDMGSGDPMCGEESQMAGSRRETFDLGPPGEIGNIKAKISTKGDTATVTIDSPRRDVHLSRDDSSWDAAFKILTALGFDVEWEDIDE